MGRDYARIFGNNVYEQLNSKNILLDDFANYMGYTLTETMQLVDGNLMVSIQDMNKIANYLNINIVELSRIK